METRIVGVAFTALSASLRVLTWPLVLMLAIVENIFSRFECKEEDDPDQRFNFALAFANGQRQDVYVCGTDTSEPKKLKLVLDINVLPDRKFEVVSATNLLATRHATWLPWDRFMQMAAYYVLKVVKIAREILRETDGFLDSCTKTYRSVTVGTDVDRKRISPKKRIAKSRVRYFKRYIRNLKCIVGLARPEVIRFDPIEGIGDNSLNGSLNASKVKEVEKRKHPTESEDTSDYTDEEESNTSGNLCNGQEKQSQENGHDPTIAPGQPSGRKKDYFEVDENYVSAEDPDYLPSHDSSSSDSDVEEDSKEALELEHEKKMLREDQLNEINGAY